MLAAGLLGVGAVAVIVGFVFLFGVYFEETTSGQRNAVPVTSAAAPAEPTAGAGDLLSPAGEESQTITDDADPVGAPMRESMHMLQTLCDVLRVGVAVAVIVLVWMTAKSYLTGIYTRIPWWAAHWVLWILVIDLAMVLIILGVYRFVNGKGPAELEKMRARSEQRKRDRTHRAGQQRPAASIPERMSDLVAAAGMTIARPDEMRMIRTVQIAIYCTVAYSLFSVVGAIGAVLEPPRFWNHPHPLLTFAIGTTVVWVLLVSLVPLGTLLAPAFGPRARPHDTSVRGAAQGLTR